MGDTKETNPKDAIGVRKVPTHHIPTGPLYYLGLAMLEGAIEYGSHNYREAGCRHSVYYDAAKRHIDAHWEGEDIDPKSGFPHLIKAAACCFVLMDSIMMKNDVDDRPLRYPNGLPIEQFNKMAGQLMDKLGPAKEPYIEKNKASYEKNNNS